MPTRRGILKRLLVAPVAAAAAPFLARAADMIPARSGTTGLAPVTTEAYDGSAWVNHDGMDWKTKSLSLDEFRENMADAVRAEIESRIMAEFMIPPRLLPTSRDRAIISGVVS